MARSHADGKPKGRVSAYAFFVQTCREDHKKKHPSESVVFAEFSKKCADRWKTMVEKEKGRFHSMSEKDKKRYDVEMANWIPPKGEKGGSGKRKRTKDPNAPKRALSAFFWFCNDERPKVKAIRPDATVGDVAKELGKRWSTITDSTKSKYAALAAKDKARYDKEMVSYKKTGIPAKSAKNPTKVAKVEEVEESEEEGSDEEEEEDD